MTPLSPTDSTLVTSYSALENSSTLPNLTDQRQEVETEEAVIYVRWMLEGMVLPVIGVTGIIGMFGAPFDVV